MQNVMFSPSQGSEDGVASTLAKISRGILLVTFGLLPILNVPLLNVPLDFSKVLFAVVGVCVAIIFYSLSVLRSGSLHSKRTFIFAAPWLLACAVGLSALFSGDVRDAFIGDNMGVHTAFFMFLSALVVSTVPILGKEKSSLILLYGIFAITTIGLGCYHIARLFFGAEFLSLGFFTESTSTPLGNWNDLAIFFGLALLLVMVAIEQLPLTIVGRTFCFVILGLALTILAVVNFSDIWFILGFTSLVVLMYALTKKHFSADALPFEQGQSKKTLYSVLLAVTVFICSAAFIIGGSGLSSLVANKTDTSYVEVRPSFAATLQIARGVYGENAITGIGANKFSDAWRLHKDVAINQTVFWNTAFESGAGYLPTFVVTTGIVGVLAWIAFLLSILYAGLRTVLLSGQVDRFWYFAGVSSFISATYLWLVSGLYVPGPTILLLAAIATGILFVAYTHVVAVPANTVLFGGQKRTGFILVLVTMFIIIMSVSTVYFSAKQYKGQIAFAQALSPAESDLSIEDLEKNIVAAYNITNDDQFLREITSLQLIKMNSWRDLEEPTEAQIQQYRMALARAVESGELSVAMDRTESTNWQTLAAVYSNVITAAQDEAYTKTRQALETAVLLDPKNPQIKLQFAQMESRAGNLDAARNFAIEAIQLKNNYSEAYLFVAQLDIARGDVDSAIESASAVVSLEPQNPARYYQLGILHASNNDLEEAAQSFEYAIAIDQSYANARYFLALTYHQLGRTQDAIDQLTFVQNLNPDNQMVSEIIEQLKTGGAISDVADAAPIQDSETQQTNNTVLDAEDVPDSPLLTPVNQIPSNSDEVRAIDASEQTDIGQTSTSTL